MIRRVFLANRARDEWYHETISFVRAVLGIVALVYILLSYLWDWISGMEFTGQYGWSPMI
jgi:thiamine transporter ThiT